MGGANARTHILSRMPEAVSSALAAPAAAVSYRLYTFFREWARTQGTRVSSGGSCSCAAQMHAALALQSAVHLK